MGGGDLAIKTQQLWSLNSDLKDVRYRVFPPDRYNGLFDPLILEQNLSRSISDFLSLNGIKNQNLISGGGKGGGGFSFLDLIRKLWDHRDLIGLILTIFGKAVGLIHQVMCIRAESLIPQAYIQLELVSPSESTKLSDVDIEKTVNPKLANLLLVAIGLSRRLSEQYSGFHIDLSIGASIEKKHCYVTFFVPHDHIDIRSRNRYLNIINVLRLKPEVIVNYRFTNWMAISRREYATKTHKSKTYYLLFSSRVFSDLR